MCSNSYLFLFYDHCYILLHMLVNIMICLALNYNQPRMEQIPENRLNTFQVMQYLFGMVEKKACWCTHGEWLVLKNYSFMNAFCNSNYHYTNTAMEQVFSFNSGKWKKAVTKKQQIRENIVTEHLSQLKRKQQLML